MATSGQRRWDPKRFLEDGDDRLIPGWLTRKQLGDLGEEIAAAYLMARGYDILERSWRCSEGEADLIAYDVVEEQVVLVEVKTRRCAHAEDAPYPEEAVDERKQRRYRRIAACYVLEHYPVPSIRFDVIAVTVVDGAVADVTHIYSAFDWEGAR